MKKLVIAMLLVVITLAGCTSCTPKGRNYYVKYRVHYPGGAVDKEVYAADEIQMSSHRGTNYIRYYDEFGEYRGCETSAPIQLVEYRKLKK
jgi:uncharacterized lipoprotein NlpE involved in copper resistance